MPTGLLERGELLDALDRDLADSAHAGRAVLVAGEAGIGKSSLVRAFIRRHGADARVLIGMCDPLLTPRALGPLHDIARQTGGALAARLAAAPDEGASREAVFAALLDELGPPGSGARRHVIVVEDVHWADDATLDLLVFLGRRLERVPALLVATYRDDELAGDAPLRAVLAGLPADRTQHLRPAPLSEHGVAELARAAGSRADGLHALTGGNPLLVTEVLAAGSADAPAVPGAVTDLVVARTARLPEEEQEVVRFVSVVPGTTELWLLETALRPSATAVEACAAAGLLVLSTESAGFRHELLRRAVEASLSPLRRRELNRTALAALTSSGRAVDPARLAHHAREAGDAPAVLRHASAAARQAARLGAHREAVGHYRAALSAGGDELPGPDRAALLEGLSFHAYLIGHPDEALVARREAVALREAAGQTVQAGDDWRWLSRLSWWTGRRAEAEAAADRALDLLEQVPPGHELAMAYSNRSQLDMLAQRSESAIVWGERALAVAHEIEDVETIAHALTNIGTARLQVDDERGAADLEQAIELSVREDLPDHAARAHINLAYTRMEQHHYDGVDGVLERGIAYCRDRDLTSYTAYLRGTRACVRLDRGDWAGAEEDALAVIAEVERPGAMAVPAQVTWGRLQVRRGDPGAAATLDQVAAVAYPTEEVQRIGPVAGARAEHAWLTGDLARTAEEAARGLPVAVAARHAWFTGELVWWLRRAGEQPEVPSWVAEPYGRSLADDWRGAATAWAARGCPYEQAQALAEGDEAAQLEALAIFDRVGAAPAARLVRRRLAERGAVHVPRGPRPSTVHNPAGLTDRQLEVLELVAAGLTNAEVAERLTLSVRTVDHHVSAVLARLGVDSRAQAADAARRLSVLPSRDGQVAGPR